MIAKSVLTRNIPSAAETSALEDGNPIPKALRYNEDLGLKLCVNTAKLLYSKDPDHSDCHVWQDKPLTGNAKENDSAAAERLKATTEHRASGFEAKFIMNNAWMKGKNHDQVAEATQSFKKWIESGVTNSP